jgi:hypothetical protein
MKIVFLPVLAFLLHSCGQKTKYPVHQIPKGYEGFVVVVFNQPGFPELPTNRKNQFLHYPSDGILVTASSQLFGISADQAIETTSHVDDHGVRQVGKVRLYESGGIRKRGGIRMPSLVKAVGSDAYWHSRNAADYAAKVDEAEQKILRLANRGEPQR